MRLNDERIDLYVRQYRMDAYLNKELLSCLRLYEYEARTNVYREEELSPQLMFLVEGEAKCTSYLSNGRQVIIAVLKPFMLLGDFEIFSDEPLHNDVYTTKDSILLGIPVEDVYRYGAEDPRLLKFILNQLQEKFSSNTLLQKGNVLTVRSKLALYIMNHHDIESSSVITLPDKESLASFLGTSHRHMNRVIREFVENGILSGDYPEVRILDREGLYQLVDE